MHGEAAHGTDERFFERSGVVATALIVALLIALASTAAAANQAGPGDPLYGAKATVQDLRLALTLDPTDRIPRAMDYAAARVEEARAAVVAEEPELTRAALTSATGHVRTAVDTAVELEDQELADLLLDRLLELEEQVATLIRQIEGPLPAAVALADLVERSQLAVAEIAGRELPVDPTATPTPIDRATPLPTPRPTPTTRPTPTSPTEPATPQPPDGGTSTGPTPPPDPGPDEVAPAAPALPGVDPAQAPRPGAVAPPHQPPPDGAPDPSTQNPLEPTQPAPAGPPVDDAPTIDILPADQPQSVVAPDSR